MIKFFVCRQIEKQFHLQRFRQSKILFNFKYLTFLLFIKLQCIDLLDNFVNLLNSH